MIHATLRTEKAFNVFNSQDGFGAEAKLVILAVGTKYVNRKLEIGASAAVGFTISINLFEAYEWIKEQGGTINVLIN